jgi:hypothetical protein
MKAIFSRKHITTGLELIGAVMVTIGIGSFSTPIALMVAGVFLILIGGLSA